MIKGGLVGRKKPWFWIGLAVVAAGVSLWAYRLLGAGNQALYSPLYAGEFAPLL